MRLLPRLASLHVAFACLLFASDPASAMERLVDPRHAAASDSGEGTAEAPFRSIKYAMSKLQPGDHLAIAAGEYRDALIFPERDWTSADTVIEGRGKVLVKGSDEVGEWKALGGGRFVKEWSSE